MYFGISSGKLSQLVHYGPISAIFLILWITINAFNCLSKWFYPNLKDPLSILNFCIFWLWPMIIFYNYFRAIFLGPGFVPKRWRPVIKEDEKYLQYCQICKGFKAPRAHHCKKCSRCVMKLDHHCPWINTCIGHFNHANFCWFLFDAILGCMHALFMLCPCIYRVLFVPYYPYGRIRNEPIIQLTFIGLISSILSIGFAIGVIIAVGFLLIIQLRNIMRNQTTIENWILRKARDRDHRRIEPFIYPYNLGFKENFRQIFNLVGDGLTWPVRTDCDQYTLTREQIEQKFEKSQRAVRCKIISSYNGSFFPFIYDLHTCICIPCSNETRISVKQGDYVFVTRWENYWLYGTCITSNEYVDGWFPRCCVDEKFDIEDFWLLEKINFKISKKLS